MAVILKWDVPFKAGSGARSIDEELLEIANDYRKAIRDAVNNVAFDARQDYLKYWGQASDQRPSPQFRRGLRYAKWGSRPKSHRITSYSAEVDYISTELGSVVYFDRNYWQIVGINWIGGTRPYYRSSAKSLSGPYEENLGAYIIVAKKYNKRGQRRNRIRHAVNQLFQRGSQGKRIKRGANAGIPRLQGITNQGVYAVAGKGGKPGRLIRRKKGERGEVLAFVVRSVNYPKKYNWNDVMYRSVTKRFPIRMANAMRRYNLL